MSLMTLDQWTDLSEQEQQVLLLKSSDTSGLDSAQALEQRIIDFVHTNCLDGAPVSMAALNRRYGRHLRSLNLKIMDLLLPTFSSGKLRGKRIGAATLLYTPQFMDDYKQFLDNGHSYEKDIERRGLIIEGVIERFWGNAR